MTKKRATKPAAPKPRWKFQIVGHDVESPEQLLANPFNFRIHSSLQQQAMSGTLDEVGWVRAVLVNKRTGHVVDGHMRVGVALDAGEQVPVDYIDVDEATELKILATLDPIAAMAGTDKHKLGDVMKDLNASASEQFKKLLGDLRKPLKMPTPKDDAVDVKGSPLYAVLVPCSSQVEQMAIITKLQAQGFSCQPADISKIKILK